MSFKQFILVGIILNAIYFSARLSVNNVFSSDTILTAVQINVLYTSIYLIMRDARFFVVAGILLGVGISIAGLLMMDIFLIFIRVVYICFFANLVATRYWAPLLASQGKPQLAIQHYNNMLKWKPKSIDLLNDRGTLYFSLKQYPEALADYNQLLQNIQKNPVPATIQPQLLYELVYINLASTHLMLGNFQESVKFSQEGLEWPTISSNIKISMLITSALAHLYMNNPAYAIEIFQQVDFTHDLFKQMPNYLYFAQFSLALAHYQLNNYAEAKALWEQLPPDYHQSDDNTHLPDHIQVLIDEFRKMMATQG